MSDMPPNNPGPQDPVPPSTPPGAPMPGATTPEAADIEKNKVMAIIAYFGVFVLIPIFAAKESPFARYHANQGLLLCIAAIIGGIIVAILAFIGAAAAAVTWGIGACFSCVIYVAYVAAMLALMIFGIINAASGKMKPLPVIGKFTILK